MWHINKVTKQISPFFLKLLLLSRNFITVTKIEINVFSLEKSTVKQVFIIKKMQTIESMKGKTLVSWNKDFCFTFKFSSVSFKVEVITFISDQVPARC